MEKYIFLLFPDTWMQLSFLFYFYFDFFYFKRCVFSLQSWLIFRRHSVSSVAYPSAQHHPPHPLLILAMNEYEKMNRLFSPFFFISPSPIYIQAKWHCYLRVVRFLRIHVFYWLKRDTQWRMLDGYLEKKK